MARNIYLTSYQKMHYQHRFLTVALFTTFVSCGKSASTTCQTVQASVVDKMGRIARKMRNKTKANPTVSGSHLQSLYGGSIGSAGAKNLRSRPGQHHIRQHYRMRFMATDNNRRSMVEEKLQVSPRTKKCNGFTTTSTLLYNSWMIRSLKSDMEIGIKMMKLLQNI